MATIDIRRGAATVLSPVIDDNSKRRKVLNGEDYVNLSFDHNEFVELFPGDFIIWGVTTYIIKQTPGFKKSSARHFEYDIRFEGPYYGLKEASYLLDSEGQFSLSGTAEDFIDQMVVNLNRVHGAGVYNTGTVASTEIKNLTFNNKNCWDVLKWICEEFDLEFTLSSGININLATTVGTSTGLSYEYHSGLRNIERQKVSGKDLVTRLYAYGAEKNIDYNYDAKRLHLPVATYPDRYMDNGSSTYGIREEVKHFDDIYPHFTGTVDSSSANNVIVDAAIDFDLNSYLMEGLTAKIVFKTGDLAGMQFEISEYVHASHQVTFNTYTDEHGEVFPSATFNPSIGDEYTFIDIAMPAAYITAAESALAAEASTYLSQMSAPNVLYEITMDHKALQAATTSLDVGDLITITDAELAIGGLEFRILELSQSIADQYKYTIKLGEQILQGYLARMRAAQDELQRQIYQITIQTSRATRASLSASLQALAAASEAQSAADGKIVAYYQDAEPAGDDLGEGDIWFDTNDGNKIYVYHSGAWVESQDSDIAAAISSAQTAQSTADGKAIVFFQTTAPNSGMSEGDIWIDTDNNYIQYVYSGAAWVLTTSSDALQALSDAAAAQSTADGKIVSFWQDSMPAGGQEGDIWFDTNDGNKIYVYRISYGGWVESQDDDIAAAIASAQTAQTTADGKAIVFYQDAAPISGMSEGDIWVDIDNDYVIYVYSGSDWILMTVVDAVQALSDAAAAQSTADGKIASYYQATAPSSGMDVGDIWFDTDDGNRIYIFRAAQWVDDSHQVFRQTSAPTSGMVYQDWWIDTDGGNAVDRYNVTWASRSGTTFIQDLAPTSFANGDLWIDSDGNNAAYVASGGAWVAFTHTAFVQNDQPTNGSNLDVWVNPDNSGGSYPTYLASGSWQNYPYTRYIQTSPPSSTTANYVWFDSDDSYAPHVYHIAEWADNQDESLAQVINDMVTVQAASDGKVTTFFAPSTQAPTAEGVGDLWYQTDTGKLIRWDGSTWGQDVADTTQTVIDGGLITTGRIEVKNSTTTQGGLQGTTDAVSTEIGLWLGATYANRASAPFRVTHEGAVTMSNATVSTGTSDYSNLSGNTLAVYAGTTLRAQLTINGARGDAGELYLADNSGYSMTLNPQGLMRGGTSDYVFRWQTAGSLIVYDNVLVGDATAPYSASVAKSVTIAATGVSEDSRLELVGNRTANGYLGSISIHNTNSTEAYKRVVQLGGYRYNDNDAGQFVLYVADSGAVLRKMWDINTASQTWGIAGSDELVLTSAELRPYANGGLNLGSASYRYGSIHGEYLYLRNQAPTAKSYRLVHNNTDGDLVSFESDASDIRFKINRKQITNATEKILELNGITFQFNKLGNRISGQSTKGRRASIVAQDLLKVLPEGVRQIGDTGYLDIDDRAIIALLVEGNKELYFKITALETELNQLKAQR